MDKFLKGAETVEHGVCPSARAINSQLNHIMARAKRNSPIIDDAKTRAALLATIDPAMDFGNNVSLAALNAKVKSTGDQLDAYNALLSELDDALNQLEKAEGTVSDLSSRLLSGVKTKYGADSSEYEKAGGTRKSEIKRGAKKTPPAP